ncbi:MAG: ABC-2 family transporter protein [Anaerolineales bacterium]|jgi:ABC-2 type transport system permease protein
MSMYLKLVKLSFQRQITYRAATLAGLATNYFFGLLRAAVLIALYGQRQQVAGITLQGAITYTGVSQATIAFLSLFSWYDVMRSVYTGEIGADLLKPMDYFTFWMARDFGRALAQILLRGLPIMLGYALYFGITTPQSVVQWLALLVVLVLAWLVSFSWRFLVNLAAFWIPDAVGIGRLFFALSWFFSGFLMPLRFFPDWFVRLCYLTPFPQTINTIVEVYLGLLKGADLARALLGQVVWIIVLVVAGRLVLRAGVRRLVIQGG